MDSGIVLPRCAAPLCRALLCSAVLCRTTKYLPGSPNTHNPRYHHHRRRRRRRRSAHRQGNARYLTPVLDLANHAAVEDGGGTISCGASGELMLRAGRALAVGDEVLLDYQVANGPLMLATYGFLNLSTPPSTSTQTDIQQQPGYCVDVP